MEPCVQIFPLNNQVDGKPVFQVVLFQQHASVSLLTFGATLQHFQIQVNGFEKRDVVLGYPDWQSYKTAFDRNQSAYFGAIVGPIAGRINRATIPWKGAFWDFVPNEEQHLLHSGVNSFANHNWTIKETSENPHPSVTFELQEGKGFNLPGILYCAVTYTLKEYELDIQIETKAIDDTVANPTQHSYFNPNGHQGSILDTITFIKTKRFLKLNAEKIPLGTLKDISHDELKQITLSEVHGYPQIDHAFVINDKQDQAILIASDGFQLFFTTNQPVFQVYIGGKTDLRGKDKHIYHAYSGICLEQQAEPDAPNHKNFSDIYLKKGQKKLNTLTINFEQKL
jgi:aldose 1-epimerase